MPLLVFSLSGFNLGFAKASSLPAEKSQIVITHIDPASESINDWTADAILIYGPIDTNQPGTTITSTSYQNCAKSSGVVFVPVPDLIPCTQTFDRRLEVYLPKQQVTFDAQQRLAINFDPAIIDKGANYQIETLYLDLQKCAACDKKRVEIGFGCYESTFDYTNENIQDDLIIQYTSNNSSATKSVNCKLRKGDYPERYTRESVLKILKGRHDPNHSDSDDLLDKFSAIPTKIGSWIKNKSLMGDFNNFCPTPWGNGYQRTDIKTTLRKEDGWPYRREVEILIYQNAAGDLCEIRIDGTGKVNNYFPPVRFYFDFKDNQLVLLRTEEPEDSARTFKYENNQPLEYIYQPDKHTENAEILYWHRDAAKEWPERMDYIPDPEEFEKQQAFADFLVKKFLPKLQLKK
jgi:hypothetical protein